MVSGWNSRLMKRTKVDLLKKLQGISDPRSTKGIFSRGANIYNSGSHSAHSGGGPQFGRPSKKAIQRRMGRK